jgi:hypothetical protein
MSRLWSKEPDLGVLPPAMTVAEIIEAYREQQRARLADAWERLGEGPLRAVREVRNFDPYLWSIDHEKVGAKPEQRDALVLWCHERCTGRWMFNELPNGDLYLFELAEDAARFRNAPAEAG